MCSPLPPPRVVRHRVPRSRPQLRRAVRGTQEDQDYTHRRRGSCQRRQGDLSPQAARDIQASQRRQVGR